MFSLHVQQEMDFLSILHLFLYNLKHYEGMYLYLCIS